MKSGRALSSDASAANARSDTHEFSAQSRPRIVIHPRRKHLTPDSKRYCESWLSQEYRVSGTVVVPQMRCWWD